MLCIRVRSIARAVASVGIPLALPPGRVSSFEARRIISMHNTYSLSFIHSPDLHVLYMFKIRLPAEASKSEHVAVALYPQLHQYVLDAREQQSVLYLL